MPSPKPKEVTKDTETIINDYLKQMKPEEKLTYEIAKDHLGSSFDIYKSIGFLKYKEKI